MDIHFIYGWLTLLRPCGMVVACFAEKYGDVEGLVTHLENADNPLSVTLYKTELGQEAYIELVSGEYRLRLTRKYAALFLDFLTEQEKYYVCIHVCFALRLLMLSQSQQSVRAGSIHMNFLWSVLG